MSGQLGFLFDGSRCTGCGTCQVACKDRSGLPRGAFFRRVLELSGGGYERVGKGWRSRVWCQWISMSCHHCGSPSCLEACPEGALVKGDVDGVVVVDEDLCTGCKACLGACPYGALWMDPGSGRAVKCDFCTDLRSRGEQPVCVASCPMRALGYGPLDRLRERYGPGSQSLEGLPPADLTAPSWVLLLPAGQPPESSQKV